MAAVSVCETLILGNPLLNNKKNKKCYMIENDHRISVWR